MIASDNGEARTVIVTGAAGGIGAATVGLLVARGANVLAVDIDGDALAGLSVDGEAAITARRGCPARRGFSAAVRV